MRRFILAGAVLGLLPTAALAQAPPTICLPQSKVIAVDLYLKQAGLIDADLADAVGEPQRQADAAKQNKATLDAAVAKQKADDAAAPKPGDVTTPGHPEPPKP